MLSQSYSLITCSFFIIVGWLDCPAAGHEIGCIIPSKVPLGEAFNDSVLPGKRYSSRQVIHQQRVLGRKVSLLCFSLVSLFCIWACVLQISSFIFLNREQTLFNFREMFLNLCFWSSLYSSFLHS